MSLISGRAYSWTEKAFQKKLHGYVDQNTSRIFCSFKQKKKKSNPFNIYVSGGFRAFIQVVNYHGTYFFCC